MQNSLRDRGLLGIRGIQDRDDRVSEEAEPGRCPVPGVECSDRAVIAVHPEQSGAYGQSLLVGVEW
jgi:hypothetical protein